MNPSSILDIFYPSYNFSNVTYVQIPEILLTFRILIFVSIIFLLLCILFVYIFTTSTNSEPIKFKKIKNFKHDLLSWKQALIQMKNDQKKNSKLYRARFYILRVLMMVIIIWILLELYLIDFYSRYFEYTQIIYLCVLVIEYCVYLYSLTHRIKVNYNRENNSKTCLMIPFGGSKLDEKLKYMETVIQNALVHFDSNAIFLLHNGYDFSPKFYDEIKQITTKYNIRYVYLPVPNKTYAIYYCAKNIATEYTQVLIIDDDVMLPADMFIPTLGHDVVCAAFPICASIPRGKNEKYERFLTSFQNIEYVMSGLVKMSQASWNLTQSTTLSHHGAIGLWKKKELVHVLSEHDGVFHGEDLLMGIIALNHKYRMKVIDDCLVPTETPKQMTGNGGLIKQRINSWDYILLKYFSVYIKLLFLGGQMENFILKIFILHELWTIFVDLQRIPIILYILYMQPANFLIFSVFISIINIFITLWCNYVILPYYYRSTFMSIMLYPFYKYTLIFFRIIGELKYLFKYTTHRFRNPLLIGSLPELPNILDTTDWNLNNFNEIEWEKIWNDSQYARRTLRIDSKTLQSILGENIIIDETFNDIYSCLSDESKSIYV